MSLRKSLTRTKSQRYIVILFEGISQPGFCQTAVDSAAFLALVLALVVFGITGDHFTQEKWRVVTERSSPPDPSSGIVSSRVQVQYSVMTLVPLSKGT